MPSQAKRPGTSGAGKAENRSAGRASDTWSHEKPEAEGAHPDGGNAPHHRDDADQAPPANVAEALARARKHSRAAASETIATLRALLDAASLGASGEPCEAHAGMATLARSLDEFSASLAGNISGHPSPMVQAILDALDEEIHRWEKRSAGDAEARAVLRAFLGLREILWELGLCRSNEDRRGAAGRRSNEARDPAREHSQQEAGRNRKRADPKPPARSPRRVQRVKVQT